MAFETTSSSIVIIFWLFVVCSNSRSIVITFDRCDGVVVVVEVCLSLLTDVMGTFFFRST